MSIFFLDSSALVKRYMPEVGTVWVRGLTSDSAGHDIIIAQITPVELISAISRHYHDNQISLLVFQAFKRLLRRYIQTQYQVITLSNTILLWAMHLHETYRLRAYDSVQLATALELNARLLGNRTKLTFVTADVRLLQAATAERLTSDNPNNYP